MYVIIKKFSYIYRQIYEMLTTNSKIITFMP